MAKPGLVSKEGSGDHILYSEAVWLTVSWLYETYQSFSHCLRVVGDACMVPLTGSCQQGSLPQDTSWSLRVLVAHS